jgi:hypothetical protein
LQVIDERCNSPPYNICLLNCQFLILHLSSSQSLKGNKRGPKLLSLKKIKRRLSLWSPLTASCPCCYSWHGPAFNCAWWNVLLSPLHYSYLPLQHLWGLRWMEEIWKLQSLW